MKKGMQKAEGKRKKAERVNSGESKKLRASVLECAGPPALFKAVTNSVALKNLHAGRDVAPGGRPQDCHRPRSSGRNPRAHDTIHVPRCAAEHGADGASAPSLATAGRRGAVRRTSVRASAWLEILQTPASSERGSASRSTSSATDVSDHLRPPLQRKPRRVTDPRSETINFLKGEK
jgi:hypothetical protein